MQVPLPPPPLPNDQALSGGESKQPNGRPTIPGLEEYGDEGGEMELVDMEMGSSDSEDDEALIEAFPPPEKGEKFKSTDFLVT